MSTIALIQSRINYCESRRFYTGDMSAIPSLEQKEWDNCLPIYYELNLTSEISYH